MEQITNKMNAPMINTNLLTHFLVTHRTRLILWTATLSQLYLVCQDFVVTKYNFVKYFLNLELKYVVPVVCDRYTKYDIQ